jgi:Cu2+-exporting ATPase
LPQDKSDFIKKLQANKIVAMAGTELMMRQLAQTDIGIAMGTGTDVAIESAKLLYGDFKGNCKQKI